jgi:hypothetical protein
MSLQGKASPLGVNVLCALLDNTGIGINTQTATLVGSSTAAANYTKGTMVTLTVLDKLSTATTLAFPKITGGNVSSATYTALTSIGSASIPALGNSPAATFTGTWTGEEAKHGFIKKVALQAYTESNYSPYPVFLATFSAAHGYKAQQNKTISTLHNAKDFLAGSYSNMNDLATADITGVSMSPTYFGQDLIALGRAIDLRDINEFGSPYRMLLNLQENNAVTNAVNIAMIAAGLSTTEIATLFDKVQPATAEQERRIYAAFELIIGQDLTDVCVPLNTQTKGLNKLSDLLNLKKLFPNSYKSFTVPKYSAAKTPANSKIYYLLYTASAVDPGVDVQRLKQQGFGTRLIGILPEDLATANDAFSVAMMQIKNIRNMNIEKFAQVVTHLEPIVEPNTSLAVNGTSQPNSVNTINTALTGIAKGSGPQGKFTMCDFFGAMSGVEYNLARIKDLITQIQTPNLATIYTAMNTELAKNQNNNTVLTTLIGQANTEIATIRTNKPVQAAELNTLWSKMCKNISTEIASRALGIPSSITADNTIIYSFVDSLSSIYADETEVCESAQVLEAISNLSTTGGQSIVALMREARNAKRLGLAGAGLDNDIPDIIPSSPINGLGIPRVTGLTDVPGSFGGSPEANLIPQNLDIFNISSRILPNKVVTPDAAIEHVTMCNCDCWDNL